MGNKFFDFLKTDQNAQQIFLNSNYIVLFQKTASKTDFWPREVPKIENRHFHFHGFSGLGTSQGPTSVFKAVSPNAY